MRLLALLFFPTLLFSQKIRYENYVYADDVRTVQLHLSGVPLSFPAVNLNAAHGSLVLEFDLMGGELKDYWYSIVHCDANWNPSELETNEYIEGFPEERIVDFETSLNTLVNYTHYWVSLPNRSMKWTLSGNYLLKVWEDDEDKTPVLTRRFMVVETGWRVEPTFVRPNKVSKQDSHQEIDFRVIHAGTRIAVPNQEIKAYVLQNQRWDNCIGPLEPFAVRGADLLFDFQDKVVFPAGKEFRFFGMEQFDFRGRNVRKIAQFDDYHEVTLLTEHDYSGHAYQLWGDLNGRFSIENNTLNQTLQQCDYAKVLFTLAQNAPLDGLEVYVFGELTDWRLLPEFKMSYDSEAKAYWCEPLLKQGFYNYEIVQFDPKKGGLDLDGFTGNWFETENQYTILIYYRPYNQRYDRLMVAASVNSKK